MCEILTLPAIIDKGHLLTILHDSIRSSSESMSMVAGAIGDQDLGAINTPPEIAKYLVDWAIQSPNVTALDLGVGDGVFVFEAHKRLTALGCDPVAAQKRIYGSEIDGIAFGRFTKEAEKLRLRFPHVTEGDFFHRSLGTFSAVLGNPPYVRRSNIINVDVVRERVFTVNPSVSDQELSRQSDLYIYFLLFACAHLKIGGRLAVITADSWLTVGYGQILKRYLLENFKIERLISIDRQVFDDAEVKPVLLLATRTQSKIFSSFDFIRVRNGIAIGQLDSTQNAPKDKIADIVRETVEQTSLRVDTPWSIYFKAHKIYKDLASHPLMTATSEVAQTQIGYQTLAKEFFVIPANAVDKLRIENAYLEPLAHSLKQFKFPIIADTTSPKSYIFLCLSDKADLSGTYALRYIESGEKVDVPVRGKSRTVKGYHNKERIQEANRKNWYDLKTGIDRRGRARILVPRLIHKDYMVLWNQAGFVAGELFIEFRPTQPEVQEEHYLAVLNSSVAELMFRSHAQLYGGGTYNMNAAEYKKVPIINPNRLTPAQLDMLRNAYGQFSQTGIEGRQPIDSAIAEILALNESQQCELLEAVEELRLLSLAVKE